MPAKIIRTGLAGYGTGGAFFHAPFIHSMPEFELTAVLERSSEKSKERYPYTDVVRSIDELCGRKDIELIVITTPNDTHYEFAKKALIAGKHVVVDKPFTVTVREAEELITLAEKNKRVLTVYHNRRFHADFRTLKKILEDGVLGEIQEFEARFDRYRPEARPNAWKEQERPGAGILYDLGSHLLDQALQLFGWPAQLSAEIKIQRQGVKAPDYFEVLLYYPTGLKVILNASMLIKDPGPLFRLKGSNGSYTKHGTDPQEERLRQGIMPDGDTWADEPEANYGILEIQHTADRKITPLKADYRDYYRNVYEAIVYGKPLEVTTAQALQVIRLIELAIKSNVENKALINL